MSSSSLAGLVLEDAERRPVPIESILDGGEPPRWLVVQALRYYG